VVASFSALNQVKIASLVLRIEMAVAGLRVDPERDGQFRGSSFPYAHDLPCLVPSSDSFRSTSSI